MASIEWNVFQQRHRQNLIQLGVPEVIVSSEKKWYYFLEHGNSDEFDFDLSTLTIEQVEGLLKYIQLVYRHNEAEDLMLALKNTLDG